MKTKKWERETEDERWFSKSKKDNRRIRISKERPCSWYRRVMLAYIYAFYKSVTWFMQLPDPTNSQAMYISTIVGAGAAFFGLYVGKPGTKLPKNKK